MKRSSNLLVWIAIIVLVVGIIAVDYLVGPGHRIVTRVEEEAGLAPEAKPETVLPTSEDAFLKRLLSLHAGYAGNATGGAAPGKVFALAVATVDGRIFHLGEHNATFPLGSAGRALILAQTLRDVGEEDVMSGVGMFATGMPANSMLALEARPVKLQNPFTTVGAMAGACLIKGSGGKDRLAKLGVLLDQLAGVSGPGLLSADSKPRPGNYRALALAYEAADMGLVTCNPEDAVMVESTVANTPVTLVDLAVMGATLANQGVNPVTTVRTLSPEHARFVLAAMSVGGLSDMSGPWAAAAGLPAFYSEAGALMAVVPGRLAVAAFAPGPGMCHRSQAAAAIIEFVRDHNLHPLGASHPQGVKETTPPTNSTTTQ